MASLARLISSLKPQPINPSFHKLLGFNYLSTQLTLKLSPTHQPFYSSTRSSNYFTAAAYATMPYNPNSDDENKIVNRPCVYAIKLEEPGGIADIFHKTKKNHTTGVCMLWPKEKNFHFGEHRNVSVQGQCLTSEDTYLNVTGGSGIFKGVQGKVKLQKICIEAPVELFYLEGIEKIAE